MPLRVLFFGTPAFAVPSLSAVARSAHPVVGVITQPDRSRGRGQTVQPEAVKLAALEHQLPIWQPDRLKDPALLETLGAERPDLGIVVAYGRLLPQALLDLPRLGCVNVHASLLPRWRGAAPIHRAILAGDRETGITIMRVVLALDAGPVLARVATPIDPHETSAALASRLAALGARLLVETVDLLAIGRVTEEPQDESGVTYAAKLERADSPIDWSRSAQSIHDQIRGLHPWPLAATSLAGRRVLLLRSMVASGEPVSDSPGTIVDVRPEGLVVAAGAGTVRVIELQPEGRRAMPVRDFLNGTKVSIGDRFNGAMGQ